MAREVAFGLTLPLSALICLILWIIVISYRQTIRAYPNGGGAYAASKVTEYKVPTIALGKGDCVVICGTPIDSCFVAVNFVCRSSTCTTNVNIPAPVGAPVIAPRELSDRPGGRLPLPCTMVHEYEPLPPEACSWAV
jgi:hypothetical protein